MVKRFGRLLGFLFLLAFGSTTAFSQTAVAIETLANSMSAGTWAEVTTSTNLETTFLRGSSEGNSIPFTMSAAWDPVRLKAHILTRDHNDPAVAIYHVIYDATTNDWAANGVTTPLVYNHGYDHITIDPKTGTLYSRTYGDRFINSLAFNGTSWNYPLTGWNQTQPNNVAHGVTMWTGTLSGAGPNGAVMIYNCGAIDSTGGQIIAYDPVAASWIINGNDIINIGGSATIHCAAEYSAPKNVMVFGGGDANPKKVWKMTSNHTITALTDCPITIGIQNGNLTVDPVSGNFLVMGSDQLWELNPDGSGTWTQKTGAAAVPAAVGNPTAPDKNSVFSFPISNFGVVAYVTCYGGSSCNWYLYKNSTWPMTFDQKVAIQPGLVRSHIMSSADVNQAWGNDVASFNNELAQNFVRPALDTSVTASGKPSLKFTIPSLSGSDASGQWTMRFASDNSVTFGAGDVFYVQYEQKFDRYLFEHQFTSGQGWKQDIIGKADGPGCTPSNTGPCATSCSYIEVVVQNTDQVGFPRMYNRCPSEGSTLNFEISNVNPADTSDFDYQPFQGTGPLSSGTYCSYHSSGSGYPQCKKYSMGLTSGGDQTTAFGTFTQRIWLGPVVGGFWTGSNVEVWVSWGGRNPQKVFDYTTNLATDGSDFGRIWLLPFHTNKSTSEVHNVTYTWYANVIISTEPIPLVTAETTPACTPTTLAFSSQPSNAITGASLGTVSVAIRDAGGFTCTDQTTSITLSKNGSATWGTLNSSSSLTKAAVAGVATWTDLFVTNNTGSGPIDAAATGLTEATSNSIVISAPPSPNNPASRIRMRRPELN